MTTHRPAGSSASSTLISVVVVVAALYFAREVFIPLALAMLFSFLLAPLVVRLRHWGWGRVLSVVSVVCFAFLMIAVIGGFVTLQLAELGHKLPEYEKNIHEKIRSVRDSSSGVMGRAGRVLHDVSEELNPAPPPPPANAGGEKPVPVEIRHANVSPFQLIRTVAGSLFSVLVNAAIVVVFVIFMLLQREDLRDRFIRLLGARRLNVTTKALDEAADRVSRYLQAQLIVNLAFGIPAAVGLYFLGIPNPILWGVLASLMRYIPYLGIWLAAAMPAAVAFAIDPGWVQPFAVFGIYAGIDLCMYNFVEPFAYGSSTGMTPLAILVATVFWTWLWGPVGLLLATPLTVCVAVLGRYVPSLQFLGILLSDEPVLSPEKRFYQRLLALDAEEATGVAAEFLKGKSLEELYDRVIVPALVLAEGDRHSGRLDEEQERSIFRNVRMILEDIAERAPALIAGESSRNHADDSHRQHLAAPPEPVVLSLPARDEADELAAFMLAQLLLARGIGAKTLSASALVSERLAEAAQNGFRVVAVCAVPPFGYMHARYLCKQLRAELPQAKVVAAILNGGDAQEIRKRQPPLPADEIAGSLSQAAAEIISLAAAQTEPAGQKAFSS